MCDGIILDAVASMCMQVDIQDVYISNLIVSVDYGFGHGFGNVIDDEDLQDLETPTECEDEDEVFQWKAGCASEAGLRHKVEHEDRDDDTGPPMNIESNHNGEVDCNCKFHNDASFVHI